MTMEHGAGRHRPPGAGGAVGMRSMSMIGAAGIFTMVLLLAGWGAWSVLGGERSPVQAQAASSLGALGSGVRPLGSGSGVGTASATDPVATSSTISRSPGPSTTSSSPPIAWGVTNVSFSCTLTGRRVQAALTFTSTETVTAVLRAGGTTTTKTGTGAMSVTVSGLTPPADCWAVVDGHTIGTIPAT